MRKYLGSVLSLLMLVMADINLAQAGVHIEPSYVNIHTTSVVQYRKYMPLEVNLVQGTSFRGKFLVGGDKGRNRTLKIMLVDEQNMNRIRAGQQYYYYKGATRIINGNGSFSIRVSKSGRYYMIISNNVQGTYGPKAVRMTLYTVYPRLTETFAREQRFVDKLYRAYRGMFKLPHFDIRLRVCGIENAMSYHRDSSIDLCRELISKLNKKGLGQAAIFILHHEFAHSALRLWGWPISDNEDVADEFATVLAMMFGQRKAALSTAQYYLSQDAIREFKAKLRVYDRHTISPQRARNIVRWMQRKDELLKKWQRFLATKMTDKALRVLKRGWEQGTYTWVNIDVIRDELRKRRRDNRAYN